jgi:Cdc6-like AAA superfamily ATPase
MHMMEVDYESPPLDIIVEAKDDWVKVELDVRNNERVKVGDYYVAQLPDGARTILQVTSFETVGYDNMTARQTTAMREGVTGVPATRTAREEFQRKFAIMHVVGELLPKGLRRMGAMRLPDRLTPVECITDDVLEEFTVAPDGNVLLGNLRSSSRILGRSARIAHNFAGDRLVILGRPGMGKSQLVRALLSQLMADSNGGEV